jgi:hypothetical protein
MEHEGQKYPLSVADFSVLQCQNCGEIYLDVAASERLSDALRAAAGLLSPTEIREKREDDPTPRRHGDPAVMGLTPQAL